MTDDELYALFSAAFARSTAQEKAALDRAVLWQGSQALPRPHLRSDIRGWFDGWQNTLIAEFRRHRPGHG